MSALKVTMTVNEHTATATHFHLEALSYREVATRPLVHGVRSTQVWVASVRSSVMLRLRKAVYLVLLAADGPSIFAVTARGWLKIPTSQNERV